MNKLNMKYLKELCETFEKSGSIRTISETYVYIGKFSWNPLTPDSAIQVLEFDNLSNLPTRLETTFEYLLSSIDGDNTEFVEESNLTTKQKEFVDVYKKYMRKSPKHDGRGAKIRDLSE